MPKDKDRDLPSTLQKSPAKAKRTYRKAHDSAVDSYGEGQRAHRTAYSALKHSFEKQGDHWEPNGKKGPSDPQAAKNEELDLDDAESNQAPAEVLERLRALPGGRAYENVQDVWATLGGTVEHRF
jgi:cation transport regulator ChaB